MFTDAEGSSETVDETTFLGDLFTPATASDIEAFLEAEASSGAGVASGVEATSGVASASGVLVAD
jgi:hypothetical protein